MQNVEYINNLDENILENIQENKYYENTIKLMIKINSSNNKERLVIIKEIINKIEVREADVISIYGLHKKDIRFSRNNNSLILLVNTGSVMVSFDEFYKSVKESYSRDIIKHSSIEEKDDLIILTVPS